MKYLALGLLLASFHMPVAHAVGNGLWEGQLNFSSSDGDNENWDCRIGVQRSATKVYFHDMDWCTYMYDSLDIDADGTTLLDGGQPVGTITNDDMLVKLAEDDWNYSFHASLNADGNLSVDEVYAETDYSDKTAGTLNRSVKQTAKKNKTRHKVKLHR